MSLEATKCARSINLIFDLCYWNHRNRTEIPANMWKDSYFWDPIFVTMLCLHMSQLLTHCGLVTPYGARYLSRHWFRWWLDAWRHQAITWTNVDLSSVRSRDIHLRKISQSIPHPSSTEITLKITYLKIPFKSHRGQWVKGTRWRACDNYKH